MHACVCLWHCRCIRRATVICTSCWYIYKYIYNLYIISFVLHWWKKKSRWKSLKNTICTYLPYNNFILAFKRAKHTSRHTPLYKLIRTLYTRTCTKHFFFFWNSKLKALLKCYKTINFTHWTLKKNLSQFFNYFKLVTITYIKRKCQKIKKN